MPPSTFKRVSAHSHVRGLGLNENGQAPEGCKAGLVGQTEAREAAGIIIDLVRMKKLAGRAVLFAGKPGTGKTAIALAMSQELGTKVPFCPMVASEVYSSEVKKTEILMENFRKAIGVRVRETKEVYEGEVVEFTPVETENPIGSVGKTIGSLIVKLKATKGTKTLNLDPAMYDNFQREKIEVGDVIYIEVKSGAIVRQGRCDVYAAEYDLEAEEYVPLPKGDVRKTRQVVQDFTLHDIDAANANAQGGQDILSKIRELVAKGKTEITDKLRAEVDKIVDNFIDEGIAELVPGVLFIDEVHMLDVECFVFLHKVLESKISPIVIFSTNRGMVPVRGNEEMIAAHGIPADLLDRLLIIKTVPFTKEEQKEILKLKAEVEEVVLDESCLDYLADLGYCKTLRYAIQLLNPAKQLSQISGGPITTDIILEASQLFIDIQRSSEILAESARNGEAREGGDKFMK